jgi:hypothetical protein
MTNYEEMAAQADKYFPFYNGYDPERQLPKDGQVILALIGGNTVRVVSYKEGLFDQVGVFRWWPTRLFMRDNKFFEDTPEMRKE